MSLVLPKEESRKKYLQGSYLQKVPAKIAGYLFYNHLGDNPLYVDPDSKHFAQVF